MERTRVDKIAREIGCIERQMEVEEKGLHIKISATHLAQSQPPLF